MLDLWREQNTAPFRAIAASPRSAGDKFVAIGQLWIDERDFEPAFDGAIREWARVEASVAAELEKIDQERMAIFERIFLDLGYPQPEAMIRARVAYYHQVGYYTLAIKESRAVRDSYAPYYTRILSGRDLLPLPSKQETPEQETPRTPPPHRAAMKPRGAPG